MHEFMRVAPNLRSLAMEALTSSRAWLPAAMRTAGRGRGSGAREVDLASRSVVQSATLRSGCRVGLVRKWKNASVATTLVLGPEAGRFGGAQCPLLHHQHRLQRRGESTRSTTNDTSRSGADVAVVSDDDVETHRRELLARHWDEGFGAAEFGRESGEREAEAEGMAHEGPDEVLLRNGGAAKPRVHSGVGSDGEGFWWKSLHVRRILTPRTKGIILLNILTFLYGSNISIIKTAGTTMDPTLFSLGRFAIASLVFIPFLRQAITDRTLRRTSVELGLLASAGYLTQCISILTSDASRVSFISTFTVIVVPLLAGLSGAKISKMTWIAAATALLGVGILESSGSPFAVGDLWSFLSAVMFGVHMLRTEHHSKALAQEDSLPVMALQLVVITMCSGIWFCSSQSSFVDLLSNFPSNWPSVWEKTVFLQWLPILYTGLLSTAFCLWIELVSLRDVKATEAAVIYTTEPLWGAAFAWLTLGERWGPNGWLGAFFILGGSLTVQLFGHPDSPTVENSVLPPVSLDLVDTIDTIDSSVEEEHPLLRIKEREADGCVEVLHKKKTDGTESLISNRES